MRPASALSAEPPLAGWRPPPRPIRETLQGRYVRLEPLTADHAEGLWPAFAGQDAVWRWMPAGPFADPAAWRAHIGQISLPPDPLQHAVRMQDGTLAGTMSLMRIAPEAGSIETGWIAFAPRLQRTREATEAVHLHMKWAFEAGYRRFEWKCNARNLASRRAAQRFGLSYEGTFRQAAVVKGESRDTAWFAASDADWPALRAAFETWLDPANFDPAGRQRCRLSDLTAPVLAARDPALGG